MNESGARYPLSVIVLTRDEELNIGDCLRSVDWAEDVIVVDSGSTDETVVRARMARPDVKVHMHAFRDFGDQRNWALENTGPRHEWILFLDADERCTVGCEEAIRTATGGRDSKVGYFLTYRNFLMGRWIRRSTLYPSWQLRLLKKGHVRYQKEGHGQKEVADGELGYLHAPYDHYGFSKGIRDWLRKHAAYTSAEVELVRRLGAEPVQFRDLLQGDPIARRRSLKRLAARLVWVRALIAFPYRYLFRGGILDGVPGLVFCLLWSWVELQIAAKYTGECWRGSRL